MSCSQHSHHVSFHFASITNVWDFKDSNIVGIQHEKILITALQKGIKKKPNIVMCCFKQSNCKYKILIAAQQQAYNSRLLILLSEHHYTCTFYLSGPLLYSLNSTNSSDTDWVSSLSTEGTQFTTCKIKILYGFPYLVILCISYFNLFFLFVLQLTQPVSS